MAQQPPQATVRRGGLVRPKSPCYADSTALRGAVYRRPAPPNGWPKVWGPKASCPSAPKARSDPLWELALYKTRLLRVTALRV